MWLNLLLLASMALGEELTIKVVGPQLDVYVDGLNVGSTPLVLDVTAGAHTVRAKKTVNVSVRRNADDDGLMNALYAAEAKEQSIETEITLPDGGTGSVVFLWSKRRAEVTTRLSPEVLKKIADAIASGNSLRSAGKFMEAIFTYQEALGLGGDDAKVEALIAQCEKSAGKQAVTDARETADKLCAEGNFPGAFLAYDSAIAMGAKETEIRPLIEACKAKEQLAIAVSAARSRGDALAAQGKLQAAIEAYREAFETGAPPEAFLPLIEGLVKTMTDTRRSAEEACLAGDYATGIETYELALSMGGNQAEVSAALANCKQLQAKGDAAENATKRAATLAKKGQLGAAITSYEEAINLGADKPALSELIEGLRGELSQAKAKGDELCADNDFLGAFKAYDKALAMGVAEELITSATASCREREEKFNNLVAIRERADSLAAAKDLKGAVAAYRQTISLGGPKDEIEAIIEGLEMKMAKLVVSVRGRSKDTPLQAYLKMGNARIEPASINGNEVIFDGIPSDTTFRLVVGARGYTTAEKKVPPIPGRQSSSLRVDLKYLGLMTLEISHWEGPAKVNWEQKSGTEPLKAGSHEISALDGAVVVSSPQGSLSWPYDGKRNATYEVDVPTMLPSQILFTGLPEDGELALTAGPTPERIGPIEIPNDLKTKTDGPFKVREVIDIHSLRAGSYGYSVAHPILGNRNGEIKLSAGQSRSIEFDWRVLPRGAKIASDYEAWRQAKRSVPKEAWVGIGTGVAGAGALGLMSVNLVTAKNNERAISEENAIYQAALEDRDIAGAQASFENKDHLRVLRNQGLVYATLEGTLGVGSAAVTAWMISKVLKKKKSLQAWSNEDYSSISDTKASSAEGGP
jgi:tetratricopeptide (TPR) repeat protein